MQTPVAVTRRFEEALEEYREFNAGMLAEDPQYSFGPLLLKHAVAAGLGRKIYVDDYSQTDKVLPMQLATPSTAKDPLVRMMENDEQKRALFDVMGRRRGLQANAVYPLIEEW